MNRPQVYKCRPSHLPSHPVPLGCPRAPALGALLQALNLHWPSTLHMVIYMFQCAAAATAAKSLQSCLTLCDPIDGSLPGSPVPGILRARILEWVAISFSSAWKWKVKVKSLSHVQLLATPWTVAHQAPPSMGFSRREYWVGCHCLLRCFSVVLLNHPTLTFSHGVQKSVLYISVSFAALHVGSLVPSF